MKGFPSPKETLLFNSFVITQENYESVYHENVNYLIINILYLIFLNITSFYKLLLKSLYILDSKLLVSFSDV